MRADKNKLAEEIAKEIWHLYNDDGTYMPAEHALVTIASKHIARYLPDEADTPLVLHFAEWRAILDANACSECIYENDDPVSGSLIDHCERCSEKIFSAVWRVFQSQHRAEQNDDPHSDCKSRQNWLRAQRDVAEQRLAEAANPRAAEPVVDAGEDDGPQCICADPNEPTPDCALHGPRAEPVSDELNETRTGDYDEAVAIVKKYAPGEWGLANHLALRFGEIRSTAAGETRCWCKNSPHEVCGDATCTHVHKRAAQPADETPLRKVARELLRLYDRVLIPREGFVEHAHATWKQLRELLAAPIASPSTEPACNESHPKGTPCPVEGKHSVVTTDVRAERLMDVRSALFRIAQYEFAAICDDALGLIHELTDAASNRPISDYTGAY